MTSKDDQRKAGAPTEPRGQRMGRGNDYDPNRHEKEDIAEARATPALRGDRPESSDFFADNSSQQVGTDAVTPRSNTPSVPAVLPPGTPLGQSGGEGEFKRRGGKE